MESQCFEVDERFMSRAIDLARLGMGNTAPNPMVGCVIVHEGVIVGEGFHQEFGKAHAEVNAIESVQQPEILKKSTLYVTLEPCSHFGKTPPCSDLILKMGIPNVAIGTIDPYAQVAGRGVRKLIDGGCKVVVGCMEDKCTALNRRFFTYHQTKRPYVILKWAQTLDGFIDIDRSALHFGHATWITNDLSRIAVHKMRSDESAILVGTNTAMKDNPSLTARDWKGTSPVRILLDKNLRLSPELYLFDQQVPTIVYTSKKGVVRHNLEFVTIPFDGQELKYLLEDLYHRNILSLIVEGGQELLKSFISQHLWNEARIFVGNKHFHQGVQAPFFNGILVSSESLDDSGIYLFYP